MLLILSLVCICGVAMATDTPCTHNGGTTSKNTLDPTCTVAGTSGNFCKLCDQLVSTTPINALGHQEGNWIAETQPTCSSEGKNVKKCQRCNVQLDTQVVSKLTHTPGGATQTIAPTCAKEGYSYQNCSVCGAQCNITNVKSSTGHDFNTTPVVNDPTCTAGGTKTYSCKNAGCSETKVEGLAKLGHNFTGAYTVDSAATCAAEGSESRTCTRAGCGEKEIRSISKPAHTYPATYTQETAPTCQATGLEARYCTKCNNKDARALNKVAHEYPTTGGETITAPTCTKAGKAKVECKFGCKTTKEITLAALKHDYNDVADSNSITATCTKAGTNYFTCKRTGCGEVLKSTVSALGHKYNELPDAGSTTPSCTTAGVANFTCTRLCGNVRTETTKALGHALKETTVLNPTCTVAGSKDISCTRCAYTEKNVVIKALGHKGKWATTVQPTKSKPGVAVETCTVCGLELGTKEVPYTEMFYRNTLSAAGVRVRDITTGVTTDWHMLAPVNLSHDGRYEIDVVATNKYTVGKITVIVKNGAVSFDLKLNSQVEVLSESLTVFTDISEITSVDPMFNTAYSFGKSYNIEVDFANAETLYIFYYATATYNAVAPGVTGFTYDSSLVNPIK